LVGLLSEDFRRDLQIRGSTLKLTSKEAQLNWLTTSECLITLAGECYKAGNSTILRQTFDLFKISVHFFNTMMTKGPEDAELFAE